LACIRISAAAAVERDTPARQYTKSKYSAAEFLVKPVDFDWLKIKFTLAGGSGDDIIGGRAASGKSAVHRDLPTYRPGVGILLLSSKGMAFVGRRIHMPPGFSLWQMPQGGLDAGESPRQAAHRELKEEIGTDQAEILAESHTWLYHDVPEEISEGMMGGIYRGSRQKWFAMRFTGAEYGHQPRHRASRIQRLEMDQTGTSALFGGALRCLDDRRCYALRLERQKTTLLHQSRWRR
jgi:8-oxo-dGTP pyrophosphatase MutT (NUDIX family)